MSCFLKLRRQNVYYSSKKPAIIKPSLPASIVGKQYDFEEIIFEENRGVDKGVAGV